MSALLKRYPMISALAVLAAALLVVIALELASGATLRERLASTATPHGTAVQTKLLPAVAAVNPEQEYAETAARPLFTPTRRPAPPAAVAGSPSSMPKGQYVLTAVIIANGLKTALLREKSSGRVLRVEKGKDFNGVTVAEIEPEKITLAQGGDQEVLSLSVSKGAPPLPGAPGMGAPPGPAPSGPFAAPPLPAAAATPQVTPAAPDAANPAARAAQPVPPPPTSGFGPPPSRAQPPSAAGAAGGQAALTPEELLARRRARRAQSTQ